MNQIMNYLSQFLLGGIIIVGMSYLTKHANVKYAALLYALPIQFTMAAVFAYKDTSKQAVQNLCISTFYSLIILGLFLLCLYILLKKLSFSASIMVSYIIFLALGAAYIKFIR